MALTPDVVGGSSGSIVNDDTDDDDLNDNNASGGGRGRGSVSYEEEDLDGYDSEKCPTPELSSPLRSTNISARDLQVLTPSAAREDYSGNGDSGSYRRDSGGGGSDDESDACPTPELSSPLRSAGSAALCRRRLEEAGDADADGDEEEKEAAAGGGPLELVSEEEYAKVCVWHRHRAIFRAQSEVGLLSLSLSRWNGMFPAESLSTGEVPIH